MPRRIAMTAGALTIALLPAAPAHADETCASTIKSNFNGTAITAGRTIWLNSVLKVSGPGAVTIRVVDQKVQLAGTTVPVPDATITFSPTATVATTSFDPVGGAWNTTVPKGLGGNTFLSGAGLGVATGLPGGLNPVTWSGRFLTDTPGVNVSWQWAAAVYTAFGTDNDLLGVKPTDDPKASVYRNSDHAGTPEAFKASVTGGARGGGGSNFTGSYSATGSVTPCLVTPPDPGEEPSAG